MDYYRATEKYLYNYKSLKANIKNMKNRIENIEYNTLQGVDFEYKENTGYQGSVVENTVINIDQNKNDLTNEIRRLETKLSCIDRSMDALNETEKMIIKEKYFEGKQWWEIASIINYSERHCRRIRTNAIKKISVGLFGINALNINQ